MEEEKLRSMSDYFKLVKFIKTLLGLGQGHTTILIIFLITASLFLTLALFVVLVVFFLNPELSFGLFQGAFNAYFGVNAVITPAEWGFYLTWCLIFFCLISFFTFIVFAFCYFTADGPAILNPPIITLSFFLMMGCGFMMCIFWLFAVDNKFFTASLILNILAIIFLMIAEGILSFRYLIYRSGLRSDGRYFESFMILATGLNGVTTLITWLVYMAFVNTAFLLPVDNLEIASIVTFISLGICLAIFFIADLTVLERSSRFVLAPYIVMAIALCASITQNFDPANLSSLLNVVLLGAAGLGGLAKLSVSVFLELLVTPPATFRGGWKKANMTVDNGKNLSQYLILESEEPDEKKIKM